MIATALAYGDEVRCFYCGQAAQPAEPFCSVSCRDLWWTENRWEELLR